MTKYLYAIKWRLFCINGIAPGGNIEVLVFRKLPP